MIKPHLNGHQVVKISTKLQSPLLDAYSEMEFGDIARMAAHICQTPLALLWLSDGTRQWFTSLVGDYLPPELSFIETLLASHPQSSDLLIVPDTHQDICFSATSHFISSPYIRFYASATLMTQVGHPTGALCVMDLVPRELSYEQSSSLRTLARQVQTLLDLRNQFNQMERRLRDCQQAEQDLEHLFALSLDMLCTAGFDGYFKRLNPQWEKILGYTNDELLARPFIEFVHPDDREITEVEIEKLTLGGETLSFENRYRCKDGSYKWLLWNATPLKGQQLIYATAKDISESLWHTTQRKEAEEALRKSQERYRSVVAAMEEGVVLQDAKGTIQACNTAAERILGLTADQIIGRTSIDPQWRAIYPDGSPFPGEIHPAMVTLRTGKPCANVLMGIYKPDGIVTWIAINSQPLFSPGETKPYAAVTSFSDITEPKYAEERLRLLESCVENANDAIVITEASAINEPDGPKIVYVNKAFSRMTGYSLEEVIGKTPRFLQGPNTQRSELDKIRQAISRREPVRAELINQHKDGSEFCVDLNIVPITDTRGCYTHFLAVQRDITSRKQAEQEVRAYARASAVVAELGQQALAGIELATLMERAVTLVAQTLEVKYCQILELMPGGSTLLLRAGVGWQEGLVGSAIVAANGRSQAGYTLLVGEPVIVQDLRIETRFAGTPLLHNHRIVSGMSVIVHGSTQPFGVLSAHTSKHRRFTSDEVNFMQAVANVLATAIERKQAEVALRESEERYELAVRGSNEGLWDWNIKADTIYLSPRWKAMLGHKDNEIGDSPDEWFNRVHPEDFERVSAAITAHLDGLTQHFEKEYRMLHRDGSYRWMLCRGLAVREKNGVAYRMAGSQTDISDRKIAEEQLFYDAFHDPLTGLPNRSLFMDRLSIAIARLRRQPEYQFAVLFLDLDRFKIVNDSLGHVVGDQLLSAIARRLELCLRSGDTVARLGGDEFVILLDEINDISDSTEIADRIQMELRAPFNLDGHQVVVTASIGITLGGISHSDRCYWPGNLLRDADIALYQAKAMGKARYQVFNAPMHAHAVARLELENDLRLALEETQHLATGDRQHSKHGAKKPYFLLYYQPIVALTSGQITGFEALVRLFHPSRGMVSPVEFIPVAEETGLIIPLGAWVLREACEQMRVWQMQFPNQKLTISVNLSGKQFSQPDLKQRIEQILCETGLDGGSLKLEITESIVMENASAAKAMLQELKALDIHLSIDDFGTGYSSLSYLHSFPIDTLKIDRSFVSRMGANGENSEIVQAIVNLAHSLGMDAIAEGIETQTQLALLEGLQCEHGQGYFFSKPVDAIAAGALLAAGE
jgi:diguanylate cyclase (GGDEF)-like protein/PAS domain S-box-containing protein